MNLLRLLATGRCLVGLRETPTRYEMRTENLLPRFASKKNPFASPTRSTVPVAAAPVKLETKTLFDVAAAAPRSLPPVKAVKTPAKPVARVSATVERQPAATAAVQPVPSRPARRAGWFRRLNPLVFLSARRAGAGATLRARPARSAVQAELSLEKIRVVRNDLNDADLEIVPGRLMGLPSGASPILERESRTEPTTWGRLTSGSSARNTRKSDNEPCAVPEYIHNSVMVAEALAALRVKPGGTYADGTVGGAGHAKAVLAASSPNGWLFGCDRDGAAVEAAKARLAEFAGRFEIRRGNFADLSDMVAAESCDGVLLDLGVSSPQLDSAGRGFSFQADGPLDMRMDTRQTLTAAELVNGLGADELAKIFWELGDEPQARRFARMIEDERRTRPFATTGQLAALIERLSPRRGRRTHPATQVFQALRLAVNDELGSLQRGLAAAVQVLRPGGRLAVITFHSLEDRLVKEFGRERARDYTFPGSVDVPELRQARQPELKWVQRKAVKPGPAELAENPRSRSAQLRVMEKI